jgi:uncharacterized protein YjbJ (UPF0337 family)
MGERKQREQGKAKEIKGRAKQEAGIATKTGPTDV